MSLLIIWVNNIYFQITEQRKCNQTGVIARNLRQFDVPWAVTGNNVVVRIDQYCYDQR